MFNIYICILKHYFTTRQLIQGNSSNEKSKNLKKTVKCIQIRKAKELLKYNNEAKEAKVELSIYIFKKFK